MTRCRLWIGTVFQLQPVMTHKSTRTQTEKQLMLISCISNMSLMLASVAFSFSEFEIQDSQVLQQIAVIYLCLRGFTRLHLPLFWNVWMQLDLEINNMITYSPCEKICTSWFIPLKENSTGIIKENEQAACFSAGAYIFLMKPLITKRA